MRMCLQVPGCWFSGRQALNFVLQNKELIDKTLLFNVKVIRIDKPGQNGWKMSKK